MILVDWQPINEFITTSAIIMGFAQLLLVVNLVWGLRAGKRAERNPWQANSLEWSAPSPPPHGNFEETPTVYHGPYEYSRPDIKDDYLPQDLPLDKNTLRKQEI